MSALKEQIFNFCVFDVNISMYMYNVSTSERIKHHVTYFIFFHLSIRWLHTGSSGMAVQEFGIPTGFEADLESIAGVTEIKRTETGDRKIILYFDEVRKV